MNTFAENKLEKRVKERLAFWQKVLEKTEDKSSRQIALMLIRELEIILGENYDKNTDLSQTP